MKRGLTTFHNFPTFTIRYFYLKYSEGTNLKEIIHKDGFSKNRIIWKI
jgi:hypothetical protein